MSICSYLPRAKCDLPLLEGLGAAINSTPRWPLPGFRTYLCLRD